MRKGVITMFAVVCLGGLLSPVAAHSRSDFRKMLREGMRIKIEGRERQAGMYEAEEVILKGDSSGSRIVEGIVREVDLPNRLLNISGIRVGVDRTALLRDHTGKMVYLEDLDVGVRVKAELKDVVSEIAAAGLDILDSADKDVEIKAPIERLQIYGKRRMEIVILGARFRCDQNTSFFDPEGREIEFDFTELNVYHRLVDTDEERPVSQLVFGDIISIGGELQIDYIPERNFDLNDEMDSDSDYMKLSTILELSSRPHPDFDLFLKVAAQEPVSEYDLFHPVRSEGAIRLAEAYLLWREALTSHVGIKIGRQDFDEKREWLYDENLDGIRVYLNFQPVVTELSVTKNLSEKQEKDKDVVNYMAYTAYSFSSDAEIGAYVIDREDSDSLFNHDRRWFGLRSFGRIGKGFRYWIDYSRMRGSRIATVRGVRTGIELEAEAYDIGFTHVMKGVLWEPSFTFGLAYGSGDDSFRDDLVDGNFRQTDFEDNNDKFNGVYSFKYYGEVLDPELSNIWITTAGVGFRFLQNGSFDIVYHTYEQVVPDNSVHGSDLLVDPLGDRRSIGEAIDLFLGYEKLWNVDLKLIAGFFRPDTAFGPFRTAAAKTRFQVEYNF